MVFDAVTGQAEAIMDGAELAARLTSATSAPAADPMARNDAKSLLIAGAGTIARNVIPAHLVARDCDRVRIRARGLEQALTPADPFDADVIATRDLDAAVAEADVIAAAAIDKGPLIKGTLLKDGAHLELVGGFTIDMRETDSEALRRAAEGIIDDTYDGGIAELCRGDTRARRSEQQITVFKSAGAALEDFVAARMVASSRSLYPMDANHAKIVGSDCLMEVELSCDRHDMTDTEWEVLCSVLPAGRRGPVRMNDRRVMDGISFILRTGSPWRDLPQHYGPYTTCYKLRSKDGTWARTISDLQRVASLDGGVLAARLGERMIDHSAVRVRKHGSGSRRDGEPREIGRSRGGLTTKTHAAVDGAGRSLAARLSSGQAADFTHAPELLVGLEAETRVIADKAYDRDAILELVANAGGVAVNPSKTTRKMLRELDRDLYARRNRVERFFGKIEEFRRVATRYEKRARNYLSTALLAETRYLLRTLARRSIESTAWS